MFDNNQNPNPQAPNNLPFGQPQSPFVSPPPQAVPAASQPASNPAAMPAQAAAPIQDMFAETMPPAAPTSGGYSGAVPNYAQQANFPGQMPANQLNQPASLPNQAGYDAYNAQLFGGRSLPWGKIVSIVIIILVVIGAAGAAYGGWVYFQSLNKASAPAAAIPAATQTVPSTSNQTTVITPAPAATTTVGQTVSPVTEVKDSDGDGLIDSEEEKYGTNPNLADTDSDGLTDWAEIKIYKTNPLNPDTDGDTYKDGQEVINGYDPLKPGSARLYETPNQ